MTSTHTVEAINNHKWPKQNNNFLKGNMPLNSADS